MTLIIKELYDALIEAGASPEKAGAAAAAVLARQQGMAKRDHVLALTATKQDLALLLSDLQRALTIQAIVTIGVTVALVKLLT